MLNSEAGLALAADRRLIDRELARALRFGRAVPGRLARAMQHAVLGPGKRLRPALCLEAFRAAGGRPDRAVLPFLCGIEFIHTFSLIHDDLPSMDDDDLRRGRPTLHRRFDEATAILAADALFALAFESFTRTTRPPALVVRAIRLVCEAVGPAGMTGGQMLDIAGKGRRQSGRRGGAKRVAWLHRKKTAEFIAASLEAGAVLADARARTCARLKQAGLALGELFQITDDLLDETQEQGRSRLTAPAVHGREQARGRARRRAAAAERALAGLGREYALLAALPELILGRST